MLNFNVMQMISSHGDRLGAEKTAVLSPNPNCMNTVQHLNIPQLNRVQFTERAINKVLKTYAVNAG
jgi:hypothetical protein